MPPPVTPPPGLGRGVCDVRYVGPGGVAFMVDRALEPGILDRLNRLPRFWLVSICAGHHRGKGDRQAHLVLTSQSGNLTSLGPALEALSLTVYPAHVARYGYQGAPERWHLEVRRAAWGPAPRSWWLELVRLLEEGLA